MTKLLFICSRNKLRSPTAETVFSKFDGLDVRSAGLSPDADNPVSSEDIEWADIIFLMEREHKKKLAEKFKKFLKKQKVIVLDIPDKYDYMEPELIDLFKQKVLPFL